MGCVASAAVDTDSASRSKAIDKVLSAEKKLQENQVKLLLLGAGESGKSTIAKQMKILYKDGYSEKERSAFKQVIFANVVQSMLAIVKEMPGLEIQFANANRADDAKVIERVVAQYIDEIELTGKVGYALIRLWLDDGVRECLDHSEKYQLNDSAEYYLQELDRLCDANYIPNEQDVLRSRIKTTGILETPFSHKNLEFHLIDVGGQRSERKKWIHCFEDVTAIIFCASLSAYDLMLAEDEETNRMHESLHLFESICNNKWFRQTAMILFLNKTDLFRKKIEKTPLTVCFPDYAGESKYDQAATYIQKQFEKLNHHPEKIIYTHFTCATDTSNVEFVFEAVSDVILTKVMVDLGLMST